MVVSRPGLRLSGSNSSACQSLNVPKLLPSKNLGLGFHNKGRVLRRDFGGVPRRNDFLCDGADGGALLLSCSLDDDVGIEESLPLCHDGDCHLYQEGFCSVWILCKI